MGMRRLPFDATVEGGRSADNVDLTALHAVQAFGSGVRMSLRNNASAYGFSISITVAFGLVSTAHGQSAFVLQSCLFALGAALAFVLVELIASRNFRHLSGSESSSVVMVGGVVDVVSIAAAVGTAAGLAQIPGVFAWLLVAFGTTFVYLVVGGLDVLIARRALRRNVDD